MKIDEYELELEKAAQTIKEKHCKTVLLHLPEGLKPYSTKIVDYIHEKTGVKAHTYIGTNFGACDLPLHLKDSYDLLLHFGHSPWHRPLKQW